MLKWFLYLVILANLGVLLWHLTRYQPASEAMHEKRPLSINVEKIQLIKPQSVDTPVQSENKQTSRLELKGVEQAVNASQDVVTQPSAQPLTQPAIHTPSTQQTSTGSVKEQVSDKSVPDRKLLKTEMKVEEQTQSPTDRADNENTASHEMPSSDKEVPQREKVETLLAPQPVASCYSLNPLKQKLAEKFSQFLKKNEILYTQQHTTKVRPAGYLAMVAPSSDYKQSKKRLKQVKKAGLDAFLITKGQWQRGISLGVFSSRANAETIIKRARKKLPKINLKIADRVREEIIYRVVFKITSPQNPQDLLKNSQIMEMKGQFVAEVTKKSCKDIEF